jgi:deoxyribonuclease V
MGFATYAEVESQTGQIAWSHTLSQPIRFPYIPSYLAFRELPLLLALAKEVQQLRDLADVLIVDGSGIAHPRGAGIATMLGIVQGIPTIGITKKSLFGTVDLAGLEFPSERPIYEGAKRIGHATLPSEDCTKPIFVSPGFRVSVARAAELVRPFLGRYRLPDPIYWADRLSRQAAKSGC